MTKLAKTRAQMAGVDTPLERLTLVQENLRQKAYHCSWSDPVPSFGWDDGDEPPIALEWYEGFVMAHVHDEPELACELLDTITNLELEQQEIFNSYQDNLLKEVESFTNKRRA